MKEKTNETVLNKYIVRVTVELCSETIVCGIKQLQHARKQNTTKPMALSESLTVPN